MGEAFHIAGDEVLTWNRIRVEIAAALGVASPDIVLAPTEFICQTEPQLSGTQFRQIGEFALEAKFGSVG